MNLKQLTEQLRQIYEAIPSDIPFNFYSNENERLNTVKVFLYDKTERNIYYQGKTYYLRHGNQIHDGLGVGDVTNVQLSAEKDIKDFNQWMQDWPVQRLFNLIGGICNNDTIYSIDGNEITINGETFIVSCKMK